jgi:4-amino-4-deoxy-L-arabinose transferase-like glycosyltransferase
MFSSRAETKSARRAYRAVLLAIVVFAAIVRVYDLGNLPAGLFCDEADNGYQAYSILKTGEDESRQLLPLYVWSFGVSYKNPVFIYSSMLPIRIFGLSVFSVRLTSALWGVLAVIAMALLGRTMLGPAGGLIAAFLLAVCPWHIHFSRIAFELIALLPLFLFAFAALAAGVRGRPQLLPVAGVLFGLSLYAYAPAKLFVPLFLLGAGVVYVRRLWAVRRWTLLAALLALLTAVPVVVFDLQHRSRSQQYFAHTTTLHSDQSVRENAERVIEQYGRFFSREFLFDRGDPLLRHSVPGFGELYWCMLPLLGLGLLWAVWPGHPEGKLLLWWAFLYPIAPALMNEAPSASRGFIGVGAFCLLAACGAAAFLQGIRRLARWPRVSLALQTAAVTAFLAFLAPEAWRYWRAYVDKYPAQAADAFQYGYREAIHFMESRRRDYDLLLLTANNVNQPQVFPLFYNATDPKHWQQTYNNGYLIIDPAEYGRYQMNQRILAALRVADLRLFEDYDELHRVLTPGGRVEYVIADVRKRRHFIRDWLLLGPFDNRGFRGANTDFVDPTDVERRAYQSFAGPVYWRRVFPQFVRIELNAVFRRPAEASGHPGEWLCAYAVTQIRTPRPKAGMLELMGASEPFRVWLDGRPLKPSSRSLRRTPRYAPVQLHSGDNELLIKACKTVGEWKFTARLTDAQHRDLEGVEFVPTLRRQPPPAAAEYEPPRQMVDGLGTVLQFTGHSDRFSDYRGNSEGWWEHLGDPDGAVVWQTDPPPASGPTVFVFTASLGDAPGEAELWVNGRYALTFSTGRSPGMRRWQTGPYVLEFHPRPNGGGLSGYWLLFVPRQEVKSGKPVQLRVAHSDGSPNAAFILKGYQDTAAHESLTLASIAATEPGGEASVHPRAAIRNPPPAP